MKIRIYGTLEEIFPDFDTVTLQTAVNTYTQSKATFDTQFTNVINILADEYSKWYVGYVDKWFIPGREVELTLEEQEAIKISFLKKFMVVYNFSKEKYLTLLNLYTAQKDNLMKQLEGTTTSTSDHRENDTPQNGGTWEDDEHSSYYEQNGSTTTVSTDPMTVMARLDEIQRMFRNLLEDWCKEFRKLFITPHNEFTVPIEGE